MGADYKIERARAPSKGSKHFETLIGSPNRAGPESYQSQIKEGIGGKLKGTNPHDALEWPEKRRRAKKATRAQ